MLCKMGGGSRKWRESWDKKGYGGEGGRIGCLLVVEERERRGREENRREFRGAWRGAKLGPAPYLLAGSTHHCDLKQQSPTRRISKQTPQAFRYAHKKSASDRCRERARTRLAPA